MQPILLAQAWYVQFGLVLLFNTAIAVLLSLVINEVNFGGSLLVSQCIGITLFITFYLFDYFLEVKGWRVAIPLFIGAVVGVLLSILVVGLINDMSIDIIVNAMAHDFEPVLVNLFLALFFGSIITYFFLNRERQFQSSSALKEQQIKNLDHEKQIAETQLRLLQAQIEPHFLFNSLSNVISLIESDPTRAKLMLESMTRYLRASLSRSHKQDGTLKDELDLIESYLNIIQIRMGNRLTYKVNVPDELLYHPFPIMLLQPLVENAIHHGLEPLPKDGQIMIDVTHHDSVLLIQVMDNGEGFRGETLSGFGLSNVRQRIQSLYGDGGKLQLENNIPQGVCARIEIPYA